MTPRYAIFILAVWNPMIAICGAALVSHFRAELVAASAPLLVAIFYTWVIVLFAPGLWDAFGRKSK